MGKAKVDPVAAWRSPSWALIFTPHCYLYRLQRTTKPLGGTLRETWPEPLPSPCLGTSQAFQSSAQSSHEHPPWISGRAELALTWTSFLLWLQNPHARVQVSPPPSPSFRPAHLSWPWRLHQSWSLMRWPHSSSWTGTSPRWSHPWAKHTATGPSRGQAGLRGSGRSLYLLWGVPWAWVPSHKPLLSPLPDPTFFSLLPSSDSGLSSPT